MEITDIVKAYKAMTAGQKRLFRYLLKNTDDGPVHQRTLLSDVWKITFNTHTNVVDVGAYRLRKHLKEHNLPLNVQNYRAEGYRLETTDAQAVPMKRELSLVIERISGQSAVAY